MASHGVQEAVSRLRGRSKTRTEADLQADISVLLVSGDLNLDADDVVKRESQVGDGTQRRIDVEVGHTIIEVKKDLRGVHVLEDAQVQLCGYVEIRQRELDARIAGVLTDGTTWYLYRLDPDTETLQHVATLELSGADEDADRLVAWLESVMATQTQIRPTPELIAERLGADSPAHRLDHATLRQLLDDAAGNTEVALKRELWGKLLRTAFGTDFTDDADLFVNHTLLVLTAEAVAHAIIGFDLAAGAVTPEDLVSGTQFTRAGVYNVVEQDFFDWVTEVTGGSVFVADLARRIARFDWANVEHDVLKVLYESVIAQADREALGEYYTPEWLAERIVRDRVTDPLHQRVLDPSCGSGTFLFHAVRGYLEAAESTGVSPGQAAMDVSAHVMGLDIHPVAVTLARVTFLLALGSERINHRDRRQLSAPVFLGDALQWERRDDLTAVTDTITVSTAGDDLVAGGGALFGDDLVFPASVWADADRFDRLLSDMADQVEKQTRAEGPATRQARTADLQARTLPSRILDKHQVPEGPDSDVLQVTFNTWCRLQRSGRDHVWSFYVRNLVRPQWLALRANRVDVLVGNPPWLRYNKMTAGMQERFKVLCKERGLLTGGRGASGRDLSALFVVRAIELYLADGGRFGFVMPHGTLSRQHATGFRKADWHGDGSGSLAASFEVPWDIADTPTGFPMTACVVRGTKTPGRPVRMTHQTRKWVARFPRPNSRWEGVADRFKITDAVVAVVDSDGNLPRSPYASVFRAGAILFPRMLMFVDRAPLGPLSPGEGRVEVASTRSTQEKMPWKEKPSLSGIVESHHLHPVHLGATIAPFRALDPALAVLPLAADHILTDEELDDSPDLADWWRSQVELTWEEGRKATEKAPLRQRMDYHGQLSAQLPLTLHRVVYTASGTRVAAARVDDAASLIEHKLYWAPVSGEEEGRYLVGVLNSAALLQRIQPYQAVGLFGARDFDTYVHLACYPAYDPSNPAHVRIVDLTAHAEAIAAGVHLIPGTDFREIRKQIIAALEADGVAADLEMAVDVVLPPLAT